MRGTGKTKNRTQQHGVHLHSPRLPALSFRHSDTFIPNKIAKARHPRKNRTTKTKRTVSMVLHVRPLKLLRLTKEIALRVCPRLKPFLTTTSGPSIREQNQEKCNFTTSMNLHCVNVIPYTTRFSVIEQW